MGIIAWVIFGALAGWVASVITQRREGLIVNIVVGILGAVVGGFIMAFFGGSGVTGFDFSSFLVAVVGAVVLLVFINLWQSFR